MSDAALKEAVARAMGLQLWRSGGCLLDHDGLEWDILADDYSGVPAMEAEIGQLGLTISSHRMDEMGLHHLELRHGMSIAGTAYRVTSYPRALALAIVAAVEAGR